MTVVPSSQRNCDHHPWSEGPDQEHQVAEEGGRGGHEYHAVQPMAVGDGLHLESSCRWQHGAAVGCDLGPWMAFEIHPAGVSDLGGTPHRGLNRGLDMSR